MIIPINIKQKIDNMKLILFWSSALLTLKLYCHDTANNWDETNGFKVQIITIISDKPSKIYRYINKKLRLKNTGSLSSGNPLNPINIPTKIPITVNNGMVSLIF
jgi:hypothetical protein